MKKVIMLTTVMALATIGLQSFAVVDTNRLMSEDYLRNQGYSPELIRMMNIKKVDPYAPYVKKEEKNTLARWIKRFYLYVDPATDNQRFGDSIIDPRMDRPSQIF